jgi:hypothetical protein
VGVYGRIDIRSALTGLGPLRHIPKRDGFLILFSESDVIDQAQPVAELRYSGSTSIQTIGACAIQAIKPREASSAEEGMRAMS